MLRILRRRAGDGGGDFPGPVPVFFSGDAEDASRNGGRRRRRVLDAGADAVDGAEVIWRGGSADGLPDNAVVLVDDLPADAAGLPAGAVAVAAVDAMPRRRARGGGRPRRRLRRCSSAAPASAPTGRGVRRVGGGGVLGLVEFGGIGGPPAPPTATAWAGARQRRQP